MADTKWLEIAINTTPDRLDEVTAKLTAAGMAGLVIEDEAEFQQFLEQNRQYWDYVDQELLDRMKGVTRVKFYVTDDADGRAQLAQYTHGLDCEYTVTSLSDNDWAYSWQKYYKPLSIGERLYVVPQWEKEKPVPDGRVPFYLNPGLTFGTGSHASTQLCLEGVEAHTKQGDTVLDLGCGSGILSIAAPATPWRWTLTPRRWMWPMKTPPSMASARTATPSGPGIFSPTPPWPPRSPGSAILWCWPILWPMSLSPSPPMCPICSLRTAFSCAPASSTPGHTRWKPLWSAMV